MAYFVLPVSYLSNNCCPNFQVFFVPFCTHRRSYQKMHLVKVITWDMSIKNYSSPRRNHYFLPESPLRYDTKNKAWLPFDNFGSNHLIFIRSFCRDGPSAFVRSRQYSSSHENTNFRAWLFILFVLFFSSRRRRRRRRCNCGYNIT